MVSLNNLHLSRDSGGDGMKIKFFTQQFLDRTEIILTPALGIIVRDDGWALALVWLMWSVSLCFGRRRHES